MTAVSDFFYNVAAGEDYRMDADVQRMLATSRPGETFLLGRCEPVTQAMHQNYRQLVGL